jgi:glycosyltransferase involved in cell wall biosynthesis
MPERNRFMKGLFSWVGYRNIVIDYDRDPREAGVSKFHYWKLWNFAIEGITSFSVLPIKLASYAGLASALAAVLWGLYFLLKTLISGDPVAGFPTLIIAILFMGGLQLMATGIMGEYVGRLFLESKNRPLYLLDYYHPASCSRDISSERRGVHAGKR